MSSSGEGEFSTSIFQQGLNTKLYGRSHIHKHEIESTQDTVNKELFNLPEGHVLTTDIQTQGKGRAGNQWTSPLGCLMFTFVSKIKLGATLPFFQYLVSLAILRAVRSWTEKELYKIDLADHTGKTREEIATLLIKNIKTKWPNDIYMEGKKIGGILCQSSYINEFFIATGVGINVSNDEPTISLKSSFNRILKEEGVSLPENTNIFVRETLLSHFFNHFEPMINQFKINAFSDFVDEYEKNWMHTNQKISIVNDQGSTETAFVVGISRENGFLLAKDEKGIISELHPDGNSFDFLNGLIKKKK